jgi:hypothetical protein
MAGGVALSQNVQAHRREPAGAARAIRGLTNERQRRLEAKMKGKSEGHGR